MDKKIIIFFILTISIFLGIVIYLNIEKNSTKDSLKNIGEGATDYYKGINDAKSHLNEFTYDSITNTVKYK